MNGSKTGIKRIKMREYIIVSVFAFVCYANTLFGTFVFDDSEAIVKNKDVLPNTPLFEVFKNDFWGNDISSNTSHKSYRPLTILSYRFNMLFSGNNIIPLRFHATNVILYVILCLLLIPMVRLLIFEKHKEDTSYLSALLFTVHPLHTEVVAALVGRADLLCSILTLVSLLLYKRVIKTNSVIMFCFVSFIIFAAVLCKETAIMTVALCSVYDIFYTKTYRKVEYRMECIYRHIGLFLTGYFIMFFRFWVMNFEGPTFAAVDNPASFSNSCFTKIFTYNYVYCINALLMVWPQWLCFDWSMGCIPLIENVNDTRVALVLIFWLVLSYCSFKLIRGYTIFNTTSTSTLLAVALTVLPFIPASNLFFRVGFVIAERILLLPTIGFSMLIAIGFKKLTRLWPHRKTMLYQYFYLLCMVFAFRTILRNAQWLSEKSLFVSALEVCPLNAKVHYNIAKIAADENRKDLAASEYRRAIELHPEYEQAMNNLANLLREQRYYGEAEVLLRRAVRIRPNFAAAWMNLGIVLTNLNKSQEAETCYLKAIEHRSKYPDCYYNLGNLYLDQQKTEEALRAWERAVHYKPTHTAAWSNTLVLLDSLQKFDTVLELGNKALMHNPKSPALHFSIANTLGKLQKFEKAEKHFLEAINFNPYNALYHSNLGVLYHRWGKLEKARSMYKKALQLDPNLKSAAKNLRKLLHAQNATV